MNYRRLILGLMAIVCAVGAIWLNIIDPELGDRYPQFAGGTSRMAFVLAMLWIAMPDVMRGPAVFLYMLVAVIAVAAIFKGGRNSLKLIIPAMALLSILSFLRRFTGGMRTPTRR